jgi:hypothetical protein
MKKIAKVAEDWNASVHMTRIGSGFANGNFSDVERIITSELSTRDIPVTVYMKWMVFEGTPLYRSSCRALQKKSFGHSTVGLHFKWRSRLEDLV